MKKPKSFEESMEKLETIVHVLEKGELSLDESLKNYEEGIRALRNCESFLKKAEQKIQILLEDEDGNLKEEPFETQESADSKRTEVATQTLSDTDEEDSSDGDEDDLDSDIPF